MRKVIKEAAANVRKVLEPKKTVAKPPAKHYLSTSCTVLNLAMSGKARGGIPPGHYVFFVGDSHSGKTWLALSCLAEAARSKFYAGHRLIYDGPEDGAMMDLRRFFGEALSKRLEPPRVDEDGTPIHSETIEDFYFNVDDAVDSGPCIYVLDSMDALSSADEQDKFEQRKKARRESKDMPGSYGDGKAKANSSGIRRLLRPLERTNSILIIISQTRDNIGMSFAGKTRSGGHALKFYSTVEVWTAVKGPLTKTVKGKKRTIGIQCVAKIKKNRLTGQPATVEFPIYHSYGLDDIGACIDYLIDEGRWKESRGVVTAPELDFTGPRANLPKHVEDMGLERDLAALVEDTWQEIQTAASMTRKSRF